MLRPSYHEQVHGFGFTALDPLSASKSSTTGIFTATVDTVLEAVTDLGASHLFSGSSDTIAIGAGEVGAIGVLAPFSGDTRECYSFSINGMLKGGNNVAFAAVGTLEETHVAGTIQPVVIRSYLPLHQYNNALMSNISCSGLIRPNVNPSGYGSIASVTGLAFIVGIAIEAAGVTSNMLFGMSFEIQRWVDPDINIRTPVV